MKTKTERQENYKNEAKLKRKIHLKTETEMEKSCKPEMQLQQQLHSKNGKYNKSLTLNHTDDSTDWLH